MLYESNRISDRIRNRPGTSPQRWPSAAIHVALTDRCMAELPPSISKIPGCPTTTSFIAPITICRISITTWLAGTFSGFGTLIVSRPGASR